MVGLQDGHRRPFVEVLTLRAPVNNFPGVELVELIGFHNKVVQVHWVEATFASSVACVDQSTMILVDS